MEIGNLTGLEKPLTKLIEVVSKGIGVLYEPTRINNEAIAQAEALEIKSKTIEDIISKNPNAAALALICEHISLAGLNS